MRTALAGIAALAFLGCGEPPAPRPWRLVSLNAWGVPGTAEMKSRFERLPGALTALAPDVVCLQEVWLMPQHDAVAKGLGSAFHVARSVGGGLFLASRFPIVEDSFTPFPAFEGLSVIERLARKGWLEAVLETPGGRVRVVTTHFALQGPNERQLEVLLARLDALRDMPLVLAGDFNMDALRPAYARLAAQGFRDARPPQSGEKGTDAAPPTRVGWPRTGGPGGWSPDHVLVRGLEPRRARLALDAPDTALSDHNLLAVDIAPR